MKLVDALRILKAPPPPDAPKLSVALACGFTPLHLQTLLTASLRQVLLSHGVEVTVGVFDDLLGNVQRAGDSSVDALAVAVEWGDIDPRLGVRRLGGWDVGDLDDILDQAEGYLDRLQAELISAATKKPVVCCLPSLPMPPIFPVKPGESGPHELGLRARVASLATALAAERQIRLCSSQRLDEVSPLAQRRDLKAELNTGFPYSLSHASAIAAAMADLISNQAPKKGVITDLDGTLWAGILGEIGVDGVSWDLDAHNQGYALYQQFLKSLASAGVLIGVATKNDPELVIRALDRADLIISRDAIFPVEANWGPKSDSVAHILDSWNLGAEAVVFVDDSPIEIAEVQARFPEIEGIPFPSGDAGHLMLVLSRLRELFGKPKLTHEDAIRVGSMRGGNEFRRSVAASTRSPDEFLTRINGKVTFSCDLQYRDRALELINKTNQFNLNGRRLTDSAFQQALSDPHTTLVTASYEDRFGPLGTITALLVRCRGSALAVDAWVMSCRAFSRRIEHHCVAYLFHKFEADEITAAYDHTDRNGPLREFLSSILATPLTGDVRFTRDGFEQRAPLRVHEVVEATQ